MLHVALWEPEIPPNVGNIARLCAATGTVLHLVGRLGFRLDDRDLKRAGLDYWPHVQIHEYATMGELEAKMANSRILPVTTKANRLYTRECFRVGDCLLFGSESKGLPPTVLERHLASAITIPMPTGKVRSLNIATAVGIVLYESLRQLQDW